MLILNLPAGLSIEGIAGSNTSVFAGSFFHDYNESHARDTEAVNRSLLVGVGSAMAAGRVSHFFDLRGPSMTIDTGCSTTLTAFHQACQSLRCNESDMSIVGASNLMLNPDQFLVMSSAYRYPSSPNCHANISTAFFLQQGDLMPLTVVRAVMVVGKALLLSLSNASRMH